jgi:hypothetical protein
VVRSARPKQGLSRVLTSALYRFVLDSFSPASSLLYTPSVAHTWRWRTPRATSESARRRLHTYPRRAVRLVARMVVCARTALLLGPDTVDAHSQEGEARMGRAPEDQESVARDTAQGGPADSADGAAAAGGGSARRR